MIKSNVRASFNVICIPAAKWLEQIILNSGVLRQASGEWRCEVKLCLHWLVSVEVTVLTGNWRKQKKWTKNTQKGKLQSTLDFLFPDLLIWVRADLATLITNNNDQCHVELFQEWVRSLEWTHLTCIYIDTVAQFKRYDLVKYFTQKNYMLPYHWTGQ